MLHLENRQGGKKSINPLTLILVLLLLVVVGCDKKTANINKDITMEAFSDLKTHDYALNSHRIRETLERICYSDSDTTTADYRVRSYYLNRGTFLWIDRHGVDSRADTLLSVLKTVGDIGFTERSFGVKVIRRDLERIRTLEFDDSVNTINRVMARLEYQLTKAYLRYVTGQRFGFVNPYYVFNRLDVLDEDSTGRVLSYRKLFDIDIQRPGKKFYAMAMRQIYDNGISEFLRQVQPTGSLYYRLQRQLGTTRGYTDRMRLLCNMERLRWRESHPMKHGGRYVLVNIPAYHLYSFGGDTVVDMRVGCGSRKTKTPLLNSAIERMDVNPVWNMPMSIIKKDITRHIGDTSYFSRNRYYVVERNTGKRVDLDLVNRYMLQSGDYRVVQEGGEGNALGRIIFRFRNNFSVFLHDTSSKGVFARDNRGVSHGCIRVEHPFDLALSLLGEQDEWLIDKLRISMDMAPETERGMAYVDNEANAGKTKLIHSLPVNPRVPLYIAYYTVYPDPDGNLKTYPDVYGYDEVIRTGIKPFMK